MTILILGGVREGRDLADALVTRGFTVVTSLAGRVPTPALPAGEVRVGGFGGADGLAEWLRTHKVRAVVDATHPFAEQISSNAAVASAATRVPLLRLQRPSWRSEARAANWLWVPTHEAAALAVDDFDRILLTVGRQRLGDFARLADRRLWARMVELPADPLPEGWVPILDRGPFTVDGELALLSELGIDCVVTKDSGGPLTEAKLSAAEQLGVAVVVVERSAPPDGVATVSAVGAAVEWVEQLS